MNLLAFLNNDDILLTFFNQSRRSQESREDVTMLSTYSIEWSTRGVVTDSLSEAILFSGVLPSHSLAVDDTMLCDLYVPYKFSPAQHLRDGIAPTDLPSSLSSVSFRWIAAFLLLLRMAYDEGMGYRKWIADGP